MNYTYSIEDNVQTNVETFDHLTSPFLYILCYHITSDAKYPFIQFLVDKIPFCNNIIQEQFVLPYIVSSGNSFETIFELVLERIKQNLEQMNCDSTRVTNEMYKGIFYDTSNIAYAIVNITGLDISALELGRNTTSWFILPSEIINNRSSCNIPIDENIVNLFITMPSLSLLTNIETMLPYILPDAVYTGSEYKRAQFQSIFGVSKRREWEQCEPYHYFYNDINDVMSDSEWQSMDAITRYALFTEGKVYYNDLSLTEDIIKHNYPEPCIIIGSNKSVKINRPNVLVKDFCSFFPLSYHLLNKREANRLISEPKNQNQTREQEYKQSIIFIK
jgi:hypothetical protein